MSVFGRNSVATRGVAQALLSDLGPGMHPRVSIRGGSFSLIDAAGQRYGAPIVLQYDERTKGQKTVMLAIIIGSNPVKSRVYFEGEWDPENPGPPDCFSDNGVAPSANASSPQARTCAECEWGKWGSDTSKMTGKKTKACSEKKKLGVIIVGDTTGLVYEFQIPPATLKNMAKYVSQIVAMTPPGESRKADPSDLITAISFVPNQTGILEFAPHAWICSAQIDATGAISMAYDTQNQPVLAADEGASVAERIDSVWDSDVLNDILGLKDQPWTPPQLNAPLPGMRGFLESHGTAVQGRVAPAPTPYAGPTGAEPQKPTTLAAPASPAAAGAPHTAPRTGGTKPTTIAPAPSRALAAPAGAAPAGEPAEAIPPFLRRQAAPATTGLADAGAPPNALSSAIDKAMNLALPRS